jgi:hypothetical protein
VRKMDKPVIRVRREFLVEFDDDPKVVLRKCGIFCNRVMEELGLEHYRLIKANPVIDDKFIEMEYEFYE